MRVKRLLDFLDASPVNFLAAKNIAGELEKDMLPILAMHSCRETGSVADHLYTVKAFTQFFK